MAHAADALVAAVAGYAEVFDALPGGLYLEERGDICGGLDGKEGVLDVVRFSCLRAVGAGFTVLEVWTVQALLIGSSDASTTPVAWTASDYCGAKPGEISRRFNSKEGMNWIMRSSKSRIDHARRAEVEVATHKTLVTCAYDRIRETTIATNSKVRGCRSQR